MLNRHGPRSDDAHGIFHQHSTLFAILVTIALILAVGEFSRWAPAPMVLTGILGILILPRVFYGLAAARALDKEPFSRPAGGFWGRRNWDPAPTEEERLENAIQASEGFGPGVVGPDPSALEQLAEEEAPHTKD